MLGATVLMASQEGLEPPTPNLEGSCSILMSYWLMGNNFTAQTGLACSWPNR